MVLIVNTTVYMKGSGAVPGLPLGGGSICSNACEVCVEKLKPHPLCQNHIHFHAHLPVHVVRVSYNSYRSVDLKSYQGK